MNISNVISVKARRLCGAFGRVMVRIPTNYRIILIGLLISEDQPATQSLLAFARHKLLLFFFQVLTIAYPLAAADM
jgi:hypothetical protein